MLAPARVGVRVDSVFPEAAELVAAVADERPGRSASLITSATAADGAIEVEVSAVASRLDDGRPVALLLFVDVSARREAERTRDRLAGHVELLGRVSESLTGTLDTSEALARLASALVPALADWVSIQVVDASGRLGTVAMHDRDPALAAVTEQARQRQAVAGADRAASRRAASGEPVLLTGLTPTDIAKSSTTSNFSNSSRNSGSPASWPFGCRGARRSSGRWCWCPCLVPASSPRRTSRWR